MHLGKLSLMKTRIERKCARKECDKPIESDQDYIGINSRNRISKKWFTVYCHPECFVEYLYSVREGREARQADRRTKGLTNLGGRPRLAIDDGIRKLRHNMQIYCYKDQQELITAIMLNDPKRIAKSANKLAGRLRDLASPGLGGGVTITLNREFIMALSYYWESRSQFSFQKSGWEHQMVKNADGNWVDQDRKLWYPRDPLVIADLLVRDFCIEEKG